MAAQKKSVKLASEGELACWGLCHLIAQWLKMSGFILGMLHLREISGKAAPFCSGVWKPSSSVSLSDAAQHGAREGESGLGSCSCTLFFTRTSVFYIRGVLYMLVGDFSKNLKTWAVFLSFMIYISLVVSRPCIGKHLIILLLFIRVHFASARRWYGSSIFPRGLSCLPDTIHQTVRTEETHANWQACRLTLRHMDVWESCWADAGTRCRGQGRRREDGQRKKAVRQLRCRAVDWYVEWAIRSPLK